MRNGAMRNNFLVKQKATTWNLLSLDIVEAEDEASIKHIS